MVVVLLDAARGEAGQLARFVEHEDKNGQTALHICNNVEIARLLVKASPALVSFKCKTGCTPLHMYALHGLEDSCRFLIEDCGADVDAVNAKGQTPLHFACFAHRVETVALLLDHSAHLLARDVEQRTVLHYAFLTNRDRDVIVGWYLFTFFHAGNQFQPTILELLLARGKAQVGTELIAARDAHGKTALHYCSKYVYEHAIRLAEELVLAGVNVAAHDEQGDTAMHIACERLKWNLAFYLIKQWGLSVRVENTAGETALDLCSNSERRTELERTSVLAGLATLRLAAISRPVKSPWNRLPVELFRELCSFLV